MDPKTTREELEVRIKNLEAEVEILQSLTVNIPGMVYSARPDWTTEIITQSDSITGYSAKEFNSGKINWMNILHPDDKDEVLKRSSQFTLEQKTVSLEYRIMNKDGSTRWVLDKKTARFSEENIYLGVAGVVIDITERKQIEKELKEGEIRYKGVFDESIAAIYVFDRKKNFIDSNQAGLDLLGYSKNELLKMSISDVDADPVVVLPAHQQILDGDRIINYEHRLKRKDERVITVLNNSRPLLDNDNNVIGMLSTLIDITERRKAKEALQKTHDHLEKRVKERTAELEEINRKLKEEIAERVHAVEALRESELKLSRSRKMESLGLLAGGVAHDLNNVLSGIVSYPELLLLNLPEDSPLRNPIETIQQAGQKASDIVNDLLTVARGVATPKETLNLNDTIVDYLNAPDSKMLRQLYPVISIETKFASDLLNISGSPVHLRKIIMNLVSNAMEAIEDHGTITISTFNKYIDKRLSRYEEINIGEYAVLSVSDNGPGISSHNLERIFEPFYTKKVLGRSGTGLGLTVVWNSVQIHDGYIDVNNTENGVTFDLYFPVTRDDLAKKKSTDDLMSYKGNGETILVIDDQESQREISCEMLRALNYNPVAVSSGENSIEYLKEHKVDLLLLDMIMTPGIGGRETYERALNINPKQRAIIVSGFAETDEVYQAQKKGAGKYIKKPLTLKAIAQPIREELDRDSASSD